MSGRRLYSVLLSLVIVFLLYTIPSCGKEEESFSLPGSNSSVSNNSIELPSKSSPETSKTPEIQWNEARDYIGVEVIVCGPVVDSKWASGSNGKPTFLNIGKPYPDKDRFTVVIWEEYRDNFPETPEEFYLGKTVCVTGIIDVYKNSCQVELRSPSKIEVK
jgi:micrococcal nuclease